MANNFDTQYLALLDQILTKGRRKANRTGVDTLSIFGAQIRLDLNEGFPILTTKKVSLRNVIVELLWFLSGSTNVKYLVDNGVNIWNGDCYRKYNESKKSWLEYYKNYEPERNIPIIEAQFPAISKEEFINNIKNDETYAKKHGDLGYGLYGSMWREFPYSINGPGNGDVEESSIDQINKVINLLKNDPDSRRIIVSAWHPYWETKAALSPCHAFFQFNTEELTWQERRKLCKKMISVTYDNHEPFNELNIPKRRLNCLFYCRSQDFLLGTPYNFVSYSLLTYMVAQCVNMIPGDLIWTAGDIHCYINQIEGGKEQLKRSPRELPHLVMNPNVKDIFEFKIEDFSLEGYNPHDAIKIPLSVG